MSGIALVSRLLSKLVHFFKLSEVEFCQTKQKCGHLKISGLPSSLLFFKIWALPTLICKVLMALVMGAMIKHHVFGLKGRSLWIVAAVTGGLTQGIGYVIFWYALFGKAAAIAAVPGLTFQAVSGIIIAFVITEALQKTSLKRHFIYTTDGKGAETC